MNRSQLTMIGVLTSFAVSGIPQTSSTAPPPTDEKALAIARRALDAIEREWALSAYDRATQVRAAVNLRGGQPTVGITANLVADRRGGRLRLDTAGDVGPLTMMADGGSIALYVPALEQYARRPAGGLNPGPLLSTSLAAELRAARLRLESGYPLLVYRGREETGGRAVDVIEDTPSPGTTVTYWIDVATSLPQRVLLDRPGRRDVKVDFEYGAGTRPVAAQLYVQGQRDVQVSLDPRYDRLGRVSRLKAVVTPAEDSAFITDLTFDWSPGLGIQYFRLQPPAGATEVPFQQLVSGVMLSAAGKLGALLRLFTGLV